MEVECGACGKSCSTTRSRGVYVEKMGVQYVCSPCRKRPFDEVMDALRNGTVYVRGTPYKNHTELEKAKMKEEEKHA